MSGNKTGSAPIFLRMAAKFTQGRAGIFAAGVCLTVAVCLLYFIQPVWFHFQDLKLYDVFVRRERPIQRSDVPVVVDIDDASLKKLGQWPWPRYRLARLLQTIEDADALAVGIDIVFAESDRTSPGALLEEFEKDLRIKLDFSGLPPKLRDFDAVLARTLAGGPFSLGYYLTFGAGSSPGQEAPASESAFLPPAINLSVSRAPGADEPPRYLSKASGVIAPLPILIQAAPAAGFFNAIPDEDNILRRSPLLLSYRDRILPSLALSTVMEAYGVKNALLKVTEGGVSSLTLDGKGLGRVTIPLDGHGRIMLNYRGKSGAFPVVSAADVLEGRADPSFFKDKIVYLGTSAAGLKDLRASPIDRFMPGVEVHATITDMILTRDFLERPDYAPGVEVLCALVLGILAAALLSWTRAVFLLLPFAALGFGVWFGSAELFAKSRIFISPLYPLLALILNFMALTFLKFWREEREKRFIHSAFSHYLSPKVVNEIVDSPDKLTLTGEEREVSIIFTDVRGFTSISEKLTPTQVVDLLHGYLTPMTRIITGNMGTLDKFIGDAIMAFWNAPLDVPGHPRRAVETALAMLDELGRLNAGFQKTYGLSINIGIGLHCGRARVGNFGSADLFDYTIIGDAVNLCSRLEGLTKYYGLRLLVSDAIKEACQNACDFFEVDRVRVKGKNEPVTLYTAFPPGEARNLADELALFSKALHAYKAGDFAGACAAFAGPGGENPKLATLFALFADRCETLLKNPPAAPWDGVYVHTSK